MCYLLRSRSIKLFNSSGVGVGRDVAKPGVKLELITDIEVLNLYESMKRGGPCFVGTKRHVKANNKYLEGYDETKDSNYIMYWDAHNFYGLAMCQYLPYAYFKFIGTDDENTC